MLTFTAFAVFATTVLPAMGKPISITQQDDLAFGQVAGNVSQASTVVINATTGNKSVTGGGADLGGTHGRALFKIGGDKNVNFIITLPSSITLSSGGNTVTVDTFTSSPASPGTLDPTGKASLYVGATLNLGANQAGGSYTGTFDVTVIYQ